MFGKIFNLKLECLCNFFLLEKLRIAANSATINSSDQKEIAERIAKIFNEEVNLNFIS